MKLTDWFSAKEKPYRVGVYQRLYPQKFKPSVWYCYWDGTGWGVASVNPQTAQPHGLLTPSQKKLPWRGILK